MARHRRTFSLFARRAAAEDETLTPLLWGVDPVAPPEGLLRRIEGSLDRDAEAPGERRRKAGMSWLWPALGAGVTAAALAVLIIAAGEPDAVLRDQSGRIVAEMRLDGSGASVVLSGALTGGSQDMAWHLWGLQKGAKTPFLLGRIGRERLFLPDHRSYDRFAMSLERAGFSGSLPEGVVVPLVYQD